MGAEREAPSRARHTDGRESRAPFFPPSLRCPHHSRDVEAFAIVLPSMRLSEKWSLPACSGYFAGMMKGWPFSAIKKTKTLSGALVLAFFALCTRPGA